MDIEKLCLTLNEMVPDGVFTAAGAEFAMPLTACERASLGDVNANRISEFATGRAYAKRALAKLGFGSIELPIGPDRAPIWPSCVVGSITHVRRGDCMYAAAAVTRIDRISGLGIDFEMEHSLDPGLWSYILTPRELERVLALPVKMRRAEAQYLWCAKEATAKTSNRPFDPSQLQVERNPRDGTFVSYLIDDNRECLLPGLFGSTIRFDKLFIATAVLYEKQIKNHTAMGGVRPSDYQVGAY
jgi:hypothetical protein